MQGCFNLFCSIGTGFILLLLLLFLLSSCLFLLEGFSLLFLMSLFCNFGIFLDNLHVVHIAIVSLNRSQFFSDQNEPACALMAESDRSRSPVPGRNRADLGAAAQPVRQELPFFPRWCGPMQTAIWQSQRMSRPQYRPQFRPQFNIPQSGPYVGNPSMSQISASQSGTWPNPRFPPAPPSSPPPTLAYQFPGRPSTPPCWSNNG